MPELVAQRHEGVVVARRSPAVVDLGVDVAHRAEQLQRLVDQVGAEVEQDPAALFRPCVSRQASARGSGRQRSKRDS